MVCPSVSIFVTCEFFFLKILQLFGTHFLECEMLESTVLIKEHE